MEIRKAIIIAAAALTACAAMAGCSSKDSSSSKKSDTVSSAAEVSAAESVPAESTASEAESKAESQAAPKADGNSFDTGKLTFTAPDGWGIVSTPDSLKKYDGKTNPYSVYIIKGGKEDSDVLKFPYIWLTYYPPGKNYSVSKAFYENVKDIAPTEIGGRTWEGFSFESAGTPALTLTAPDAEGEWACTMVLENGGSKIALEDADVQEILAGIAVK
ncbi:MAG: hypothetical protein IKO27_02460 [Ruminococcus sp.]|nr:hypothetical protein [Ruminococcus sp.]